MFRTSRDWKSWKLRSWRLGSQHMHRCTDAPTHPDSVPRLVSDIVIMEERINANGSMYLNTSMENQAFLMDEHLFFLLRLSWVAASVASEDVAHLFQVHPFHVEAPHITGPCWQVHPHSAEILDGIFISPLHVWPQAKHIGHWQRMIQNGYHKKLLKSIFRCLLICQVQQTPPKSESARSTQSSEPLPHESLANPILVVANGWISRNDWLPLTNMSIWNIFRVPKSRKRRKQPWNHTYPWNHWHPNHSKASPFRNFSRRPNLNINHPAQMLVFKMASLPWMPSTIFASQTINSCWIENTKDAAGRRILRPSRWGKYTPETSRVSHELV